MKSPVPKALVRMSLPPPRPGPRRMAPAMVYEPPPAAPPGGSLERIAQRLGRTLPDLGEPDPEVTPVAGYQVVDGKVMGVNGALPSESPPPAPAAPPLPRLSLHATWVESPGTRVRNTIAFILLAAFFVVGIAGATWAFLWNGRNHQELLDHQQQEHERQRRLGYE